MTYNLELRNTYTFVKKTLILKKWKCLTHINFCSIEIFIFFSDSKKRKKPETADPLDQTMNQNLKGNSIGGAPLLDNSIQSSQLLKGLKSKTRPFVLHPELSTSTSLPLYFFLGYQILQEDKDLMESCGNVRKSSVCLNLIFLSL